MMAFRFVALSVFIAITATAVVSSASALPLGFDRIVQPTVGTDKLHHGSQAGLISRRNLESEKVKREENAGASEVIKIKREEEEVFGSSGGNEREEEEDDEEDEELLPIRQNKNVIRVSDLRPQLRDFTSYNSPDLLGPDFFWPDMSDEEIELERMSYYEMLRNEFEELADLPLDDVLQLRSETLQQVHDILLLEQQFGLEGGRRRSKETSDGVETTDDTEEMPKPVWVPKPVPADTDKLSAWLNSAATDPPTVSFSSSMLPSPNPSRLWTTIWERIRQEYWEFEYADFSIGLSPVLVMAVTNEMYDVPEADQRMLMNVIIATIEVMGRILPEPTR